jgi:hypothetical protein
MKNMKKGVQLHKCQVLFQVWLDKWDVKLISTLHTAKAVETENKN